MRHSASILDRPARADTPRCAARSAGRQASAIPGSTVLRRWFARMLVLAASVSPVSLPAADVPYLSGRVVDDAQILSPAARERIGALLKAHEDKTTDQIVVLSVPTMGGQSV